MIFREGTGYLCISTGTYETHQLKVSWDVINTVSVNQSDGGKES